MRSATYSIKLRRNWELPSANYAAGVYRVPEDMPAEHAERAVSRGIASKVMPIIEMKRALK